MYCYNYAAYNSKFRMTDIAESIPLLSADEANNEDGEQSMVSVIKKTIGVILHMQFPCSHVAPSH